MKSIMDSRSTIALALISFFICAQCVATENTDAFFKADTGEIVLPQLLVGDITYSASLTLTDSQKLEFQANLQSITDITPTATEGTTDAYFVSETGVLVMPHLLVGEQLYYATLTLTDAAKLEFQANLEEITDISPPVQVGVSVNLDTSDIIGRWSTSSASTMYIEFRSDGTYEHFEKSDGPDDLGNIDCPTGKESGTYKWSPSSGILLSSTKSDANGPCGISHPGGNVPYRAFIDGNAMQLLEKGSDNPLDEFALKRI